MGYKLTVEVPLLLCYFSFLLVGGLIVNLMTYKVCYNILHYPEANCSRLGRDSDDATQALEKIVQPKAGIMTSVSEMLPGTLTVFLVLIIAAWSDKYGRKPVLLLVLCGITIGMGINAIMLLFNELNPWWFMLSSIPSIMCGGITTFFTVTLSYLNDTSTQENKAIRMVTFDIIQIIAALCGGLSSSYLFYATSYAAVYGIGCAIIAFCTVYTYFFIPESLKNARQEKPSFSNVFTWNNLTDLFKVAGKKRRHHKRTILLLIILASVVQYFVTIGETNVKTQYLRNILKWSLTQKNNFGAWSGVVGIVCTFATTLLLKKVLKFKENTLVFISFMSFIGASILYIVATSDAYIYSSVPVGMFAGLASPMLRTMLAKMIVPEEMGKIFSLLMVINSYSMLASTLGYQTIYNDTLETHPEAFNYVSIGLYALAFLAVIIVTIFESRIPPEDKENIEVLDSTLAEKLTEE